MPAKKRHGGGGQPSAKRKRHSSAQGRVPYYASSVMQKKKPGAREAEESTVPALNPKNLQGKKGSTKGYLAKIRVGLGASTLDAGFYRPADMQPSGGATGSFFYDELQDLKVTHTTADFQQLKRELRGLVLSRALLVHNRARVAQLLLDAVKPLSPALPGVAKLTYFLCRDIQGDFLPHAPALAEALILAAAEPEPSGLPNVQNVSTVFFALAGWLRVLAPVVSGNAEAVVSLMRPLLRGLTHRQSAIARLSGELAAGLLRRAADGTVRAKLVQVVSENCAAAMAAAKEEGKKDHIITGGAAVLWFESMKGVGGRWHSRLQEQLQTIAEHVDAAPGEEASLRLSFMQAVGQGGFHAGPDTMPELINALVESAQHGKMAAQRLLADALSTLLSHKRRSQLLTPAVFSALREPLPALLKQLEQGSSGPEAEGGSAGGRWSTRATLRRLLRACSGLQQLRSPTIACFRRLLGLPLDLVEVTALVRVATASPESAQALLDPASQAVERVCTHGKHTTRDLLPLLVSLHEVAEAAGEGEDLENLKLGPGAARVVADAVTQTDLPEPLPWFAWRVAASCRNTSEKDRVAKAAVELLSQSTGLSGVIAGAALGALSACSSDATPVAHRLWCGALGESPAVAQSVEVALSADKLKQTEHKELRAACIARLAAPQPAVRLASLRLLQQVSGSDEEARILADAERGETLRVDDLAQHRMKTLAFESITQAVRPGRLEPDALRIAVRSLFGALHIRFRPVWQKAQEGLQVVADTNFDAFWDAFRSELTSLRRHKMGEGEAAPAEGGDEGDSEGGEGSE
eukprot:Hpha_TRINITY_DN15269_c0_g1::TRINITY_DN15269_c0_g1_i1::g.66898::m.66898